MKKMEISQMENLQGGNNACAVGLLIGGVGIAAVIMSGGLFGPWVASGMISIAAACLAD